MADSTRGEKTKATNYVKNQIAQYNELKVAISKLGTEEDKIASMQELQVERQGLINKLKNEYIDLTDRQKELLKEIEKSQKEDAEIIKSKLKDQKAYNEQLVKEKKNRQDIVDLCKQFVAKLKEGWNFLQAQDKVIRTTILNLGLSGTKAAEMRLSFEQSAGFMARLGGSLEDVGKIQQAYSNETGKATALSSETLKNIMLIGKGTGLGVEQAGLLVGQFDKIGVSSKVAMDYAQSVVDTSERMGINSNKVLKNISDNFKKLNTMTFQQGSKGFAQMAMYAEKMNISMSTAIDAGENAKTLEGAIDLASQLQVMGGEFAKMDGITMMFLKRNDPAEFTKRIGDMTKGLVTFRKTTDANGKSVFEKFISPADRDRLASVAKSLGISVEEMTAMTQKQADLGKIDKQIAGMGLNGREKELVEGAAKFNSSTGKYEILLAGHMRDISTLTKEQASSFAKEQSTLEERAKNALTFDESFKATINILKSALLPLLNGINKYLLPPIKWLADLASSGWGGLATTAGILLAAGGIWKVISWKLGDVAKNFVSGEKGGGVLSKVSSKSKGTDLIGKRGKSVGTATKGGGGGGKAFGKGAGIGVAAAGAGAGIMMAAQGISVLADSMSKLNKEQLDALPKVLLALAAVFTPFAIAIVVVGKSAEVSALGLLALGAAFLMIGGGIAAAAWGIGEMAKGLAVLVTAGSTAGDSMFKLAGGMALIAGSLALFSVGTIGLATFGATMAMIALSANGIEKVGKAFEQINILMSGKREDYAAIAASINSIANANVKGGGMFSEISKLLKSPLKVEFADKQVAVVSNITLNIDGHKFHEATNTGAYVRNKTKEGREGTTGNG